MTQIKALNALINSNHSDFHKYLIKFTAILRRLAIIVLNLLRYELETKFPHFILLREDNSIQIASIDFDYLYLSFELLLIQ